jgi:hypothetical protein
MHHEAVKLDQRASSCRRATRRQGGSGGHCWRSRSMPTSTAKRPILLAIDQELGESATLRVAPELSGPIGSLEVGGHEDVEFGVAEG